MGPNPTGPVYVFTVPFNSSRVRMWSWHADRLNHQTPSSSHTHHNNHTNSRQNITHRPQQIVLTCPSFTLTKTLPLFYRPKLWFTSHKDPIYFCCQYSLPRFTCTPLSLPPSPCLTCVCRPAGCLWLSACLPFSVKALGFHTLPASFGECWQVNTGIFTPMSI